MRWLDQRAQSGTPTDNPQAEGFMTTVEYEDIYQFSYETFADAKSHLPDFLDDVYNK